MNLSRRLIDVTSYVARMADMAFPAMSGMLGFVQNTLNWVSFNVRVGNWKGGYFRVHAWVKLGKGVTVWVAGKFKG